MPRLGALREVPYMGVIYVVAEAAKLGYFNGHPDWDNLGQGQPEVGPLPGAPPRLTRASFGIADCAYGPVHGMPELREAVAGLYNRTFRRGKRSKYGAENVAIAAGGRVSLSRAFAALGPVRFGYFTPDYTAYEDLFRFFPQVTPVHIPLPAAGGFAIPPAELSRTVARERLKGLLVSNPCNPTGRTIRDGELSAWVALARERDVTILFDEYYSQYAWEGPAPVSAASHVEDVNRDPVLLFDGLTKNFRYPGWRLGWTVGPRDMIETVGCAGSAIDGGCPRPLQRAALKLLEPARARRETDAMRRAFRPKRDLLLRRLSEAGVRFPTPSEGTFYAFGSIADLSPPLNDGMRFFREALHAKVLTVPGSFFDVNPNKRRKGPSPLSSWVRFSFGPPIPSVRRGVERLCGMIAGARARRLHRMAAPRSVVVR
ncbi:MAG: pyridoxal phosphate-dependent aminotransferase [Planctomycetes bacterium]|nr:pyridoxal phosphate-dependent aminotransferase [Planctomycetota bacterium]